MRLVVAEGEGIIANRHLGDVAHGAALRISGKRVKMPLCRSIERTQTHTDAYQFCKTSYCISSCYEKNRSPLPAPRFVLRASICLKSLFSFLFFVFAFLSLRMKVLRYFLFVACKSIPEIKID